VKGKTMKLLIASDIHGSAYYAKKVIESFEKEKADKLLLLGDILYHGPRNDLPFEHNPKEVIALLNPLSDKILCVRGNCEAEVDQMVLDFPCLADYIIVNVDGINIFATHGHIFGENNPPKLHKGDILLCGHTHVPKCVAYDNYIYMNPGSASIPKENSHHGYMTYDNKEFVWKDFEGNIKDSYTCKEV